MKKGIIEGILSLGFLVAGTAQAQEPLLKCMKAVGDVKEFLSLEKLNSEDGQFYSLTIESSSGEKETLVIELDRRVPPGNLKELTISHYSGVDDLSQKLTIIHATGLKVSKMAPHCKNIYCSGNPPPKFPYPKFPTPIGEDQYFTFSHKVALLNMGGEEATSEYVCYELRIVSSEV